MADFYLTRRAALDLKEIYAYSVEKWGKPIAEQYLQKLYAGLQKAADHPESGQGRKNRSAPFLIIPAEKHFVVYEPFKDGVIIITVLHQVRDIEGIIGNLAPDFLREIKALQRKIQDRDR